MNTPLSLKAEERLPVDRLGEVNGNKRLTRRLARAYFRVQSFVYHDPCDDVDQVLMGRCVFLYSPLWLCGCSPVRATDWLAECERLT